MTTDPEEAAAYLAEISPDPLPYLRKRLRSGGMYTAEEVDGLLARLDAETKRADEADARLSQSTNAGAELAGSWDTFGREWQQARDVLTAVCPEKGDRPDLTSVLGDDRRTLVQLAEDAASELQRRREGGD